MDPVLLSIAILFLVVNLTAFSVMLWDKARSRRAGAERISEATIFLLAAALGSVGTYAGMLLCRHKTRKWQFIVGIPFLMIQNVAFLYLVYTWEGCKS
jgi:uncharacterized membrane protein YsdA (DUF1294 family)